MVDWGAALFYVPRSLFARKSTDVWNLIALPRGAWFFPDTPYSLLSGYWQNAVLDIVFLFLFAVPLWATRGTLCDDD